MDVDGTDGVDTIPRYFDRIITQRYEQLVPSRIHQQETVEKRNVRCRQVTDTPRKIE